MLCPFPMSIFYKTTRFKKKQKNGSGFGKQSIKEFNDIYKLTDLLKHILCTENKIFNIPTFFSVTKNRGERIKYHRI